MEYLLPAMLIVIIAFFATSVIVSVVFNRCPRCKIRLVESSTGDINYPSTSYCPKCGYPDERS